VHRWGRGDRGRARARLTATFSSNDTASLERAALVAALARVAAGERAALQDVYRRTSAKLYGVCLRIFPEQGEAEDALQDAFVNIWQKAGSFDPGRASPITWLVTLTRNRAIDRLRSRGKRTMVSIDVASEVPDARPDAEAMLIADEQQSRIGDCIGELGSGDATMIRTAFFDGSTYAEIAERASLPLGTIKSRVRRALMKLRECLQ